MLRAARVAVSVFFAGCLWSAPVASQAAVDPAYLAEAAPEVLWTLADEPDLLAKASELATPVAIYEFARNESEFFAYHGARSSSINVFLGRRGNDVDLASMLIAMLRSQGIPARYAKGLVRISTAEAMNWIGVQDLGLAAAVLDDQGVQNVSVAPDSSYLELEHVWVQALVAQDRYRGAGSSASADCQAEPPECVWVDLDPSFKLREEKDPASLLDIYGDVSFDYEAYYNALNAGYVPGDDIDRRDKNPLEIYEEQVLAFLRLNHPGKTLEDLSAFGSVVSADDTLLPGSLPYAVVAGSVEYFASVGEHDATEVPVWSKFLNMEIRWAPGIQFAGPSIRLAELSTKRLTYTYELGDPERMVARLGGEEVWVPLEAGTLVINGETVGLGFRFELMLELDGPPATEPGEEDTVISVSYPDLTVGGYFLIATGGETSNWSQVHRAAKHLLAANEEYPTVVHGATGIVYVDTNSNGLAEPGSDTPLLEHYDAQDALTGGLLWVAQGLYYSKLRDASKRLGQLNHVISQIEGFVGVISTFHEVEIVDGTAFSVLPGGLLIDMKGIKLGGTWRIDQTEEYSNSQFELLGTVGSALEHEIWQELTGYDALSTTSGIQKALGAGHTALELKKTATEDTMQPAYADFGFSSSAPGTAIKSTWDMFGHLYVTWRTAGATEEFHVMKEVVDAGTSSTFLTRWPVVAESWSGTDGLVTALDEWCSEVDDLENQMLDLLTDA